MTRRVMHSDQLPALFEFLKEMGAVFYEKQSPWEVLRYDIGERGNNPHMPIVYVNATGWLSTNKASDPHVREFLKRG